MKPLFTGFPCAQLKMAPVPSSRLVTTGPFFCAWTLRRQGCWMSDIMETSLWTGSFYLGSCIWDSFMLLSRVHCVDVPRFAGLFISRRRFAFFSFSFWWLQMKQQEEDCSGHVQLYRKAWQLVTVAGAPTWAPDPFFLLCSTGFCGVHCGTSHMLLLPWLRCLCETSVSFRIQIICFFSHWTLIGL